MTITTTQIDGMEYASDAVACDAYISSVPSPFNDSFTGSNGAAINSDIWTISGSPDIQNNMAELYNTEQLTSKYTFTDNFSYQVDFEFQSPPSTNSYGADLWAYIDSTHQIVIRAAYYGGSKYWQTGYINGGSWSYDGTSRTNDYGKLRIVRSGASFTLWICDDAGSWTQKGSSFTIGTAGQGVIPQIRLAQWDTSPNITCRFDNYTINSGYYGISDLYVRSESSVVQTGLYALKAIAAQTSSLNKTLTRTISSPLNLSGKNNFRGFIRSSRSGSNIKIGLHDSGGTTTEITPNITSADTWQLFDLDISGISDANKDAIDQIIVTIVNADEDNTFYLDNLYATSADTNGKPFVFIF